MREEKEIICEHYEVVSSMWIGGKRMILAVSTKKSEPHPYLKCIYTENELFGRYESAIASDSYPEAVKLERLNDIPHWFTKSAAEATPELGEEMARLSLEYLEKTVV